MSTHTDLPIFDRRAHARAVPDFSLTLSFEQRSKGRLRAFGDHGREIALMLERGHVLRGGTLLTGPCGDVLLVRAAPERVSEVRSHVPRELARAAYHLGNRHVSLQIGDAWLRYLGDHVLDDMMRGLGFTVHALEAPFEPESGAYAPAGHSHDGHGGHSHGPRDTHGHEH
ncbi:MAG: urease accessory protein UreE [Gammaproteobacteria bacterium]|nr:urease accessory protein UreE [Gammaproteobacteria bacterium]